MSEQIPGDVTQLLVEWNHGDEAARDRLMVVVYEELRVLAQRYLAHERSDHTLQATALVHEAYLRLVDQTRVEWRNSLQFYAVAAKMMRRILVDHARSRGYDKRGGPNQKVSLSELPDLSAGTAPDLLALDHALRELAELDPGLAQVVELRFFGGFRSHEIAELLGKSAPTITRKWRMAKAWLYRNLKQG